MVIKFNNEEFIDNNGVIVGRVLDVPCRNVEAGEIQYWMVPVKDNGIFTGLRPVLSIGPDATGVSGVPVAIQKPTVDSFLVTRIREKYTKNTWWVVGSSEDFIAACSTCCGVTAIPMPSIGGFTNPVSPCQQFCDITDAGTGKYQTLFVVPLVTNAGANSGTYNAIGNYRANTPGAIDIAFTALAGNYANPTALVAAMNASTSWTQTGKLVYALLADNQTITVTGGLLGETICILLTRS